MNIVNLTPHALFQSTPLYEGRPAEKPILSVNVKFQSTPLYEGRHIAHLQDRLRDFVSIHAPVRGATSFQCHISV